MMWKSIVLSVIIGVSVLSAPAHASSDGGPTVTPQPKYRIRYEYLLAAISNHKSNECLLWPFEKDKDGYGWMHLRKEDGSQPSVRVHRIAFKVVNGYWPEPMGLHTCDTPACFNPRHIYAGNDKDNYNDQFIRGRHVHGTGSPHAKLTDELVVQARKEYAAGNVGFRKLASKYGVSMPAITWAITGKQWSHVPGPVSAIKQRPLSSTCKRGHLYTPENTGIVKTTQRRYCKKCHYSAPSQVARRVKKSKVTA